MSGLSTAVAGMLLTGSAALGPVSPVPPPPEQVAANCESPTYASDVLACSDPALLALDRQMSTALKTARLANSLAPSSLVEPQDAWFRRRSLCAFSARHAACLRAAYEERLAILDALAVPARDRQPPSLGAICSDAPWSKSQVTIRFTEQGAATIVDTDGRVVAAPTRRPPIDDWSPYARFVVDGTAIRITTYEGLSFTCVTRDQD